MVRTFAALLIAGLVACAASKPAPASSPASTSPETGAMPGDPRAQIDALDREIDAQLAEMQVTPAPHPCVADGMCGQVEPHPMTAGAAVGSDTCKPAQTTTCTDSCRLSDSICTNANKICSLAEQLGSADAYANEKCAKGTSSCEAARARCCGCT